jgi:phosphoribosylanthranilate isomerase
MQKTWIKICANTNLDDARAAAEAGADAVGFVFAESSKRRVDAAQVAAITPHLPAHVEKVGVFTITDADAIVAAATQAGLTMVQLHSAFEPDRVEAVQRSSDSLLKIMQVVDIAADTEPEDLRSTLRRVLDHPFVDAVLLDTSHHGTSGGTGKAFAWERYASVVRATQREVDAHIVIAGGLRPENVAAAIQTFLPWGVDVASGVEATPGRKDLTQLRAFIVNARS